MSGNPERYKKGKDGNHISFSEANMSDPICDFCGGETVHDRREGRIVCIECGTVLQEWTICDDDYDASQRCAPGSWDLGTGNAPNRHVYALKKRKDVVYAVKQKIANLVAVHGMGSAISSTADDMLDTLNSSNLDDKDSTAWTVISLACDAVKASRPITQMAACAGIPTKKFIDARNAMIVELPAFFGADGSNDLETAIRRVLDTIFPSHAKVKIIEARKAALRRADGLKTNGGFMNICPDTQARVLLVDYFRSRGIEMTPQIKSALKVNSGGVKNGLAKIET